ncbi:uncharacterized protein [Aegilops tauschii subsp. strangulata]|uniref:uncharacterized protein n=1 Tax=Aegilops tauschii subsp. strangulata TaxID=200361 RepID=UPI00098ABDEA|nr:uncharacterized protein LOC109746349 [Aegilops tauschii subsp. strangulata]
MAFPHRPMRNAGTRPCRGLVVMEEEDPPARASDDAVYYVCNPSTGLMTALPEGRPLPLQPVGYAARDPRWYNNLGIGYDEVSGRFKVVRVCRYNEYLNADCNVYVVDDAFCWRPAAGDAELPEEAGYISSYQASVSAQGHLYWMSEAEGMFKEKHVISFSLSDEKFEVIYAPRYRDYSLTELEGRACLFSSISDVDQKCYDIWLLCDNEAWDLLEIHHAIEHDEERKRARDTRF